MTTDELVAALQAELGREGVRVVFAGHRLGGGRTLADYGLADESTLHVIFTGVHWESRGCWGNLVPSACLTVVCVFYRLEFVRLCCHRFRCVCCSRPTARTGKGGQPAGGCLGSQSGGDSGDSGDSGGNRGTARTARTS